MTIFNCKVVILGKESVGKTSIRKHQLGRGFTTNHLPTMGADFAVSDIKIDEDIVKLQIWDIAGQESFKPIRRRFYSNSCAAIIVFDITDRSSFEMVFDWIKEFWDILQNRDLPLIIIGNKMDLENNREVPTKDAIRYVNKLRDINHLQKELVQYLETSALTGQNINDAFHLLAMKLREFILQERESGSE